MHLPDALWAYRKSPKSATSFSPFSLVYGTEVVSPAEIMTPSLRVMQMQEKEKEGEVFAAERFENLEELDEKREEAQEHSHRYRQKMTEAYGRMTKERVFTEGQLVLKVADCQARSGRTIQVCTKMGGTPCNKRSASKWVLSPNSNGWQGLDGPCQWKMAEALFCLEKEVMWLTTFP